MSNGLVLGGGGARGAYQIGAIKALNELGYTYSVVTGTSVGAINALLLAMHEFETLKEIWINLDYDKVVKHDYKSKNKSRETFIKGILHNGLSIEPLEKIIREIVNPKKIKNSDIKSGIVYTKRFRKYFPIKMQEVDENDIHDYLIASCSATPFLKKKKIDNYTCYDGYYSDNLPVKLAIELGATKIIAIDVMKGFRKKVDTSKIEYLYLSSSKKLGFFLNFDNVHVNDLINMGYEDIMTNKEKILEFINR